MLQNLQDCRSDDSGDEGSEAESEQEYQPEIEFSDPISSETEDELDAATAAFGRGARGSRGSGGTLGIRCRGRGREAQFEDTDYPVFFGPENDPDLFLAKNGTRWYKMSPNEKTRVRNIFSFRSATGPSYSANLVYTWCFYTEYTMGSSLVRTIGSPSVVKETPALHTSLFFQDSVNSIMLTIYQFKRNIAVFTPRNRQSICTDKHAKYTLLGTPNFAENLKGDYF
jgi:hypothetical protein